MRLFFYTDEHERDSYRTLPVRNVTPSETVEQAQRTTFATDRTALFDRTADYLLQKAMAAAERMKRGEWTEEDDLLA